MIGPNLSEWALRARSLTIYLMLVGVIAGVFAFVNLGRDEDPSFTVKTMLITAVWPGATIEQTQQQLTDRLERTLQEVPGHDAVRSITRPGIVTIFLDLGDEMAPADVPDAWYEARKRVGDIRHTLPQGVLGPFFNDDFGQVFGIIYGFTADGFTQRELRDYADDVRSALLRDVEGIQKIEFIGAQDEQIFIELDPDRVAALGLDYGAVFAAVAAQNAVRPAGVIATGLENLTLRVSGGFETETDVLNTSIMADGRLISIGDVATVRRGFVDPPQPRFHVNGLPAIGLAISMAEGGDILALGENVSAAMERIVADLPLGIDVVKVSDQPATVTSAIGDFTTSLWQAVAIILVVAFVALGVRSGTVVALAIPITLAVVFLVMQIRGIDLHRVSLGALIIALALLVDDAMTTVDAMLRRIAAGDTIERAASFAYRTLSAPMLTGTLITIAGFVPIGFAQSGAGEYTISLFQVVAIALIASWLVAVLFTPILGSVLLKPGSGVAAPPAPGRFLRGYMQLLSAAIRFRWITFGITAALFALAVLGLQNVNRQFFPPSDRLELLIDLELPRSSSIFASEAAVARLEDWLAVNEDVDFWSAYVGRSVIRFYLPLSIRPPADDSSQLVVVATDFDARLRLERDLDAYLTETFPEATTRVSPLEMGPPVGWPLQYRVSGPDPEVVRAQALRLAEVIASDPAADRVHYDWMEPARQVRIEIDQDQARRLGISSAQLANILNTAASGSAVTQLRDGIYLVDVVARALDRDRITLDTLPTLQVPVPGGRTVALSQFASFTFDQEQPTIWRRDRVPTLTVLGDVREGATPESVVANITEGVEALEADLPEGYRIELGGTVEQSADSQQSVFAVVPLMFFIIVSLLMLQLQSFRTTGIVLVLLPLGLIGVVGALLLFGRPLGFVAILGMLALLGMIAKNAVILITQIEAEREAGLPVREAAIQASVNRMRPLMLTALSTVLGLLPIAPTLFWGPMAFAVMGGLLVATLLTLVFLPALYVTIFRGPEPEPDAPRPG